MQDRRKGNVGIHCVEWAEVIDSIMLLKFVRFSAVFYTILNSGSEVAFNMPQ